MSTFLFIRLVNGEVLTLFERFVHQVVIPRQLSDRDLLKVFDSNEKVVLPPWDHMVRLFCYDLCQT